MFFKLGEPRDRGQMVSVNKTRKSFHRKRNEV